MNSGLGRSPPGQERGLTDGGKKGFICLSVLFPRDHLSSSSRGVFVQSPSSTRLIRGASLSLAGPWSPGGEGGGRRGWTMEDEATRRGEERRGPCRWVEVREEPAEERRNDETTPDLWSFEYNQ